MATTTAQIVISSTDLLSATLTINNTRTLKQSGGTDIAETTGLAITKAGNTSIYTVYDASKFADDEAAKVYIRNNDTTHANYVTITLGSQVLGRLYGTDWALIPWDCTDDFKVTNSDAGTTIEHILFHEG